MTNPPSKDNPACLLKEERQRKGITLEMVHEATKIPLDALKSIEQGYSVHKLQTFYYRGFIKIYAKYLELDETRVLQEYGMQESAAPKPQNIAIRDQKQSKRSSSVMMPIGRTLTNAVRPMFKSSVLRSPVGVVLVAAVIFGGFFVWGRSRPSQKQPVAAVRTEARSTVKSNTVSASKSKVKEVAPKESPSPVREEKKESPAKPVASADPQTPVSQKPEPAKSQEAEEAKSDRKAKPIELTVRATKSGWLQVKADGQVVFQSTLKKGDAESWKAESEIELSGKNINLLEFELNGKMLGALGASDRGAKKVVFTKDGLSVKK